MINYIVKLYKEGRELALVELAYFVITLLAFAVAGVVALFNQSLGVSILIVPLVSLIACVMNVVAWALVKLVAEQLANTKKARKAEKTDKTEKVVAKKK